MDTFNIEALNQILKNAQQIAVVPSTQSGDESFCAGAGLFYALKDSGKTASFIYTGQVSDRYKDMVEDRDMIKNVETRELFVTVDYSDTPASKVNYEIENEKLIFRLGPISKNFDLNKVTSELRGYSFDTVIVVGARTQGEVDVIYRELGLAENNTHVINIDTSLSNTRFGKTNIIDDSKTNLSQLALELVAKTELTLSVNAAKAFLRGMTYRENA